MFSNFVSWSWIGSTVIFSLGGVAGYILARQIKDQRTRQLEQDLDAARNELGGYRQDVNRHFLKTSLLFNKLTDDYREVYEHLATGAQKLCNEQTSSVKANFPETDILQGIAASVTEDGHQPPVERAGIVNTVETESDDTKQQAAAETPASAPVYEKVTENEVTSAEKSLLADDNDDVHLGEESAPAIDLDHFIKRSIH